MALTPFLALTWAEMENSEALPEKTAWLGCHFSPSGPGLSNLPPQLPTGSLLVLDDANPIQGHDCALVARQLQEVVEEMECAGVLLDFQRPHQEETREMAAALTADLPCPVAVSSLYAADLSCPVLLPPVPPSAPLKDVLWKDRECWLELALDGETITVTEAGAAVSSLNEIPANGFADETLHCHYALKLGDNQAKWALWRTKDDLHTLLEEAESLGIAQAIGLYQELRTVISAATHSPAGNPQSNPHTQYYP